MSNNESFIDEVSDEVRRDQLFLMLRRYGWIGVVLVVLLVGGAAYSEWRGAQTRAAAQAKGDAILTALDANAPEDRDAALADVPASVVSLMLRAGAQTEAGASADAAATLMQLADDPAADTLYRDMARLKAAILQTGVIPPADRIAMLEPLSRPGAPFALLAQEQIALARIEAGETDAALTLLQAIDADALTTQGLRQRVQGLIVALGGTVTGGADATAPAGPDAATE